MFVDLITCIHLIVLVYTQLNLRVYDGIYSYKTRAIILYYINELYKYQSNIYLKIYKYDNMIGNMII